MKMNKKFILIGILFATFISTEIAISATYYCEWKEDTKYYGIDYNGNQKEMIRQHGFSWYTPGKTAEEYCKNEKIELDSCLKLAKKPEDCAGILFVHNYRLGGYKIAEKLYKEGKCEGIINKTYIRENTNCTVGLTKLTNKHIYTKCKGPQSEKLLTEIKRIYKKTNF